MITDLRSAMQVPPAGDAEGQDTASALLKVVAAGAACRGLDVEEFFPESSDDPTTVPSECTRCTVRSECLQVGLTPLGEFGIWGGATEGQRRQMRRQMLRRRGVETPGSPASPVPTAAAVTEQVGHRVPDGQVA